ncbi:helix-turn-helix domain-containing protein [Streptomyces melanogenes]|uniref:helix-turn-helix domain-containing protein n=1 Tax=Streptomyces melanogenes TaxID=67326 RepID=UPI0037BA061E
MPRWKALPEELDPQVREFASQLRRLVDRSGLSLAAVADRTGYSKTSWERYLGGRLLAPKGAIVALAEVTGTNPIHLTTMWELAERAWSRAEMRHDLTMEQIRISQARAALGEFGPAPGGGGPQAPVTQRAAEPLPTVPRPSGLGVPMAEPGAGRRVPPQGPDRGPGGGGPGTGGRRRLMMFVAGVVGALLVIAAAVLLTDLGGGDDKAAPKPSVTPTTSAPSLPAGVKCVRDSCTGQDPEVMGCGGAFAKTVASAKIGAALVQVRYSQTCQAAWARIQQAAPGDKVTISAGTTPGGSGTVDADKEAYTKMLAADGPGAAKACATLVSGKKGCTVRQ